MNSRAKLSFFLTSKYSLPFEEFVHVLCCEGVGEGNRKKTGAKKNKRDRKTREKGKENKENQERIDDGLLRGEKPKEVSRQLNAQKLKNIYRKNNWSTYGSHELTYSKILIRKFSFNE